MDADGTWRMRDTYWSNGGLSIELTDQNFNEFNLIFDFNKVESTNSPEEYDSKDVYYLATNSNGKGSYYINKGVSRSKKNLINICKSEIECYERKLVYLNEYLHELEAGTHWKLQ